MNCKFCNQPLAADDLHGIPAHFECATAQAPGKVAAEQNKTEWIYVNCPCGKSHKLRKHTSQRRLLFTCGYPIPAR